MQFDQTFLTVLKLNLEGGSVPFLVGEPGIGKTSIIKALARSMNSQCYVIQVNQLADKSDLIGARLLPVSGSTSYEQRFFPHHRVREAVSYAHDNPRDWVILLLDEINRTTPDVTSAALTLSTERELGDTRLPDNVKIVVTGNDKGNVTALDDASISRFAVYRVTPNAHTLMDHLGDRLNPSVRKVLSAHPSLVFARAKPAVPAVDGLDDDDTTTVAFSSLVDASEEMNQFTTPRTIEQVSEWLNRADHQLLSELIQTQTILGDEDTGSGREGTLLTEVIEGMVGNTPFTDLLINEITTDLNSGTNGQANTSIQVPQPRCYDMLKQATTISALEDLVSNLTPNEKSGSLVFALYEKADNSTIVVQLAEHLDRIEPEHMSTFVQLLSTSMVDADNLKALLDTGGHLADVVRPFCSTLGY
ncbi:ATP-binding protein [Nocardiopsis synnemataformans]|uniref:ATP-binding protein n=1 Tax=Nocardiopsis synnemataformans TaxID=61305 RepID=UPI003EBAB2F4